MQDRSRYIETIIQESLETKQALLADKQLIQRISGAVELFIECFGRKGKVLFCGNGGSAADAQHIAAELSGRFFRERAPLNAEALHVNSSYLTAVANDYSFDAVFARAVEAKGKKGDVLVAISTSGNSPNILKAIAAAESIGMKVIGFTGSDGGEMNDKCDVLVNAPSQNTPRIQEMHILIGHILCELTEAAIFPE